MSTNQLVIASHETKWTEDQIQLLKNTVCKGATDDEFKIFCYAVHRTGLDPFTRQIHAVKRWNNKSNREDMSIQTGIDGFRLIAHRTGSYAGIDAIEFDNEDQPKRATATVYRIVQGVRCAFTGTARWSEFYPGDKQGFMWKKMPCVMLGKVAESIALRMAFPAELSGMYTNEEMAQADNTHTDASSSPRIIQNESQPHQGMKPTYKSLMAELTGMAKEHGVEMSAVTQFLKNPLNISRPSELTPEHVTEVKKWLLDQYPLGADLEESAEEEMAPWQQEMLGNPHDLK